MRLKNSSSRRGGATWCGGSTRTYRVSASDKSLPAAKLSQEIRDDVVVGTGDEMRAECLVSATDLAAVELSTAGFVDRSCDRAPAEYAACRPRSSHHRRQMLCHIDGGRDIGSSVIDARKDMAVQVNHLPYPDLPAALGLEMCATRRATAYPCPTALWVREARKVA